MMVVCNEKQIRNFRVFEILRFLLVGLDVRGLAVLERVGRHPGDEREELVLGLLVVVALARETTADSLRDVGATLAPDLLVELGVDSDVLRAHLLEGKALDGLDGPELAALAVDALVQVDGVLAGDDLLDGG